MELQLRAVAATGGERGGKGAGVVDHQEVAGLEEPGQLLELGMDQSPVAPVRHHEPHGIAREPASFGRIVRLQLPWNLEFQGAGTIRRNGFRHPAPPVNRSPDSSDSATVAGCRSLAR